MSSKEFSPTELETSVKSASSTTLVEIEQSKKISIGNKPHINGRACGIDHEPTKLLTSQRKLSADAGLISAQLSECGKIVAERDPPVRHECRLESDGKSSYRSQSAGASHCFARKPKKFGGKS